MQHYVPMRRWADTAARVVEKAGNQGLEAVMRRRYLVVPSLRSHPEGLGRSCGTID